MKQNKVLVIGPNINMRVYGGIVTHMKLVLSFDREKEFEFQLNSFTIGNRKVVNEKISIYNLFMSYLKYMQILLYEEYKIIHINSSMKNGSIGKNFFVLLLAKLFFKKCVFQFHGGTPNDISKKLKFFLKLIVLCADKVLVLTNEQKKIQKYIKRSQWEKVEKVPNFIEKKEVMHTESFRKKKYFLFVGRIIKEKGVFEIVEASKKLIDEGYDFKVLIMGDGPDLDELKFFVETLDIKEYFIFYGFITDDNIKDSIYYNSDIMLFPSYKEGFPYTLLESMCFSMPIICTKVGALPDIVKDFDNGFLINEKDYNDMALKMKYFILNTNEIKRMGSNSLNLIDKKYSKGKMKEMLRNLYSRLL